MGESARGNIELDSPRKGSRSREVLRAGGRHRWRLASAPPSSGWRWGEVSSRGPAAPPRRPSQMFTHASPSRWKRWLLFTYVTLSSLLIVLSHGSTDTLGGAMVCCQSFPFSLSPVLSGRLKPSFCVPCFLLSPSLCSVAVKNTSGAGDRERGGRGPRRGVPKEQALRARQGW